MANRKLRNLNVGGGAKPSPGSKSRVAKIKTDSAIKFGSQGKKPKVRAQRKKFRKQGNVPAFGNL